MQMAKHLIVNRVWKGIVTWMRSGIRGNGKYLDVIWDLTALRGAGFVKILACSRHSVSETREERRRERCERTKKRKARSTEREPGTGYQNLSTGCEKFLPVYRQVATTSNKVSKANATKVAKRIINQVSATWRLLSSLINIVLPRVAGKLNSYKLKLWSKGKQTRKKSFPWKESWIQENDLRKCGKRDSHE